MDKRGAALEEAALRARNKLIVDNAVVREEMVTRETLKYLKLN
jgi:hypothetical protein